MRTDHDYYIFFQGPDDFHKVILKKLGQWLHIYGLFVGNLLLIS